MVFGLLETVLVLPIDGEFYQFAVSALASRVSGAIPSRWCDSVVLNDTTWCAIANRSTPIAAAGWTARRVLLARRLELALRVRGDDVPDDPADGQKFPRLQHITIAELMTGKRPQMPATVLPYIAADKLKVKESADALFEL